MTIKYLLVYCFAFLFVSNGFTQNDIFDKHVKVAMRKIGDEVLKSTGDSTSIILAIDKDGAKYKIGFELEFDFSPDKMVDIIHQIVIDEEIATKYLVEVEDCIKNKIIYTYEKNTDTTGLVACRMRDQPKSCYKIYFTIIDKANPSFLQPEESSISTSMNNIYALVLLLIGIGFVVYFNKKKPKNNPEFISIGQFQFDKKGMKLVLNGKNEELSGKEADLLELLYSNVNNTIERELILNKVWGDEGDYIGRTLDVFISKLRKKLESDPNLKILNIRGVGYRFVIEID